MVLASAGLDQGCLLKWLAWLGGKAARFSSLIDLFSLVVFVLFLNRISCSLG